MHGGVILHTVCLRERSTQRRQKRSVMSTMPPSPAHMSILISVALIFFGRRTSIWSFKIMLCAVRPRMTIQRHPMAALRECKTANVLGMFINRECEAMNRRLRASMEIYKSWRLAKLIAIACISQDSVDRAPFAFAYGNTRPPMYGVVVDFQAGPVHGNSAPFLEQSTYVFIALFLLPRYLFLLCTVLFLCLILLPAAASSPLGSTLKSVRSQK